MLLTKTKPINITETGKGKEIIGDNLVETTYCDYSHPAVSVLSEKFVQDSKDEVDLIEKIFLFVRDRIIFGGDHWQVKASVTLSKGYGACFNKNLLMIALLRAAKIPSKLMANPLSNSFTKPSVGGVYVFFSDPFYHCFTHVLMNGCWISIDPTLDRTTYETFFKPAGVKWRIDWDRKSDMLLYSESVAGPAREYPNIDEALNKNLDSYFMFKHEPKFLRSMWLCMGNRKMWKNTQRFHKNSLKKKRTTT